MKNKNALQIIYPYKEKGSWVFDDETTGLVKEPFVLGVDKILDNLTGYHDLKDSKPITAIFSAKAFPGSKQLTKLRMEEGGGWYKDEETGQEGWFCPATLHYFKKHPDKIHYQVIKLK